eukprot:2398049-Amphidinium_carterae.1
MSTVLLHDNTEWMQHPSATRLPIRPAAACCFSCNIVVVQHWPMSISGSSRESTRGIRDDSCNDP